ncbi:MAG: alanine--tRNA ligase [Candidatus Kerfeldbacteria bacterium]|nr:alanine--tRNA ligase [Candidatus Kerfeldbacteria bacterium]
MTANELRQKYLDFFETKGHKVIPSASLVPTNDSTVLFTTAGMHPLVPYLLGEAHPAGRRLASCQKCIRTGDIEEVGDNRHLTFFEMLGNWSLGDYFKPEAIAWSFEFLTSRDWLGLDLSRLYASVFEGDTDAPRDEESIAHWQRAFGSTGLEAKVGDRTKGIGEGERIFLYPKDKNWWGPAGATGPCGPDSEMFYDSLGAEDKRQHLGSWKGSEPCHPNCDCGRYVEIWNDVFMEYERRIKNKESRIENEVEYEFIPLKQKNVDTGMGLDRTLAVLKGQRSVFDTELFKPMFDVISLHQDGMSETELRRARVVLDHVRAATFMVGDGVEPSNKDRGYVLRRLLRRAMVYAKLLNLKEHWLKALVGQVITVYGEPYPELAQNSERVFSAIATEQKKFSQTLDKALREFERLIKHNAAAGVTGKEAFDLYQSYGLPWEVTHELAQQSGWRIKAEEFEAEFKKHQELSRTASAGQFKGGLADHTEQVVRLHTATHLMNAALRQVLGEHVWQKGSNITAERTRFDFTHPQKMTDKEKKKVEELVNSWIRADYQVKREVLPLEEARKLNAIGVFGEKYADTVSVYTVYDPKTNEVISREFCGGPHVEHTGRVGQFKIIKEEAVSSGVRRLKAVVS